MVWEYNGCRHTPTCAGWAFPTRCQRRRLRAGTGRGGVALRKTKKKASLTYSQPWTTRQGFMAAVPLWPGQATTVAARRVQPIGRCRVVPPLLPPTPSGAPLIPATARPAPRPQPTTAVGRAVAMTIFLKFSRSCLPPPSPAPPGLLGQPATASAVAATSVADAVTLHQPSLPTRGLSPKSSSIALSPTQPRPACSHSPPHGLMFALTNHSRRGEN